MTGAVLLPAARLWHSYPRETLALGLLGLVGAVALASGAGSVLLADGQAPAAQAAPLPAPPPLLVRQLPPETAQQVNRQIAFAAGPNPAAEPFRMRGDAAARAQAIECLTSAIYYEAGNESSDGQRAVAQVVLNRLRHPAFPASVCGVVYQGSTRVTGCQFTFTCDGSLMRGADRMRWQRARAVADQALSGAVFAPVGLATHYHADYVVPYWASSLAKNAAVGTHIFYRWAGGWGQRGAFTQLHSGREPNAGALRLAALAAERRSPQPSGAAVAAALPGAEVVETGDRNRLSVRFKTIARKAAEEAPRRPYVEKVAASPTLRWALGDPAGAAPAAEAPLGQRQKAPPAAAQPSATAAGSAAPSPE
jgi:spore germination cell wall hydrolase CwlJ-like protein